MDEQMDTDRMAAHALLAKRIHDRPATVGDVLERRFQRDWQIERQTSQMLRAMRDEVRERVKTAIGGAA